MKKLPISRDLSLPIEIVTEKCAFLGRTGSGKTYGAQKLAELMYDAGAQFIALDNVGIWPALRMGPKALDIPVFGGTYADLPLEPTGGALIADILVTRRISVVLDVSLFAPHEHIRFCTDFAASFFQRKKSARGAVHFFLEEAQEVIPQNPQREENKMLHEWLRLWKIGRNYGIGGSIITQRPQEVNKKALNMSEVLFAFQMTGPQERAAIRSWVADKGLDVDIVDTLPKLDVGQPHVWSPRLLKFSNVVRISAKRSFDLSSTPKVGATKQKPEPLRPVDIEKIRGDMAATIEKAKQDDPKELRRQLAEMKRELAAKPGWAVERIEVPLFDKASFEELQRNISDHIVLALNNSKGSLHVYMSKALQSAGAKPGALLGAERRSVRELPARQSAARQSPVRQSAARQSEARTSKDDDGLGAGEELVLCAIAQYPDGVTHDQLAVLTGYKERTRQTYVARLSNPGFITRSGRRFLITDAGKAKLPAGFKPLPTGTELRDHWLQTLPDGERKLLELLLDAYPKSLHMSEIQTATSYAERSVQTYAHRMAAKCVIERAGRGEIRAAKELFE